MRPDERPDATASGHSVASQQPADPPPPGVTHTAAATPPPPLPLRRARWAVTTMFAVNGAALGSWVARIPVVQADLGLDEAALGVVLLGLSAGVVTALPVAGGVVARRGARVVAAVGAGVIGVALPLIAAAGTAVAVFAALVLLGAGMSSMDVAMNAQGVAVERRMIRRVMVSFHGAWSVGALVGTGIGGMTIAAGLSTTGHLAISGVVLGGIGIGAVAASRAAETPRRTAGGPALAVPRGVLWIIGLVAGSSALGEGAVADWAGVYLRDVLGTSEAIASLGFVVFSLTMAAARFTGDRAAARFGPAGVVRLGGVVAGLGFLVALTAPWAPMAVAGFGLAGVGVATVVPLSFAVAGTVRGHTEGEAVAAVATIAYSALLAGPPLIGLLADLLGLRGALAVVGLVVASLVVTGRRLAPDA